MILLVDCLLYNESHAPNITEKENKTEKKERKCCKWHEKHKKEIRSKTPATDFNIDPTEKPEYSLITYHTCNNKNHYARAYSKWKN